jgi:hypothetical protein
MMKMFFLIFSPLRAVNITAVMFTAHNGEKIKKNIFIMRVEEEKSGLLSWTLL